MTLFPWVLDIVKQFGVGVSAAAFFTQSCAVNAIYYNVHKGWLHVPLEESSVSLDGLPLLLQPSDFPSFVSDRVKYPNFLAFLSHQFARLDDADWIFTNTFDSLELEVIINIPPYNRIYYNSSVFLFLYFILFTFLLVFIFFNFLKTVVFTIFFK